MVIAMVNGEYYDGDHDGVDEHDSDGDCCADGDGGYDGDDDGADSILRTVRAKFIAMAVMVMI